MTSLSLLYQTCRRSEGVRTKRTNYLLLCCGGRLPSWTTDSHTFLTCVYESCTHAHVGLSSEHWEPRGLHSNEAVETSFDELVRPFWKRRAPHLYVQYSLASSHPTACTSAVHHLPRAMYASKHLSSCTIKLVTIYTNTLNNITTLTLATSTPQPACYSHS